ncbi:MAG: zinc ribbon domain-containing protein [Cyanobacteria bacterium P01_D01_bin.156]
MAYVCEISPNHHIYLDNQGNQTIVTTVLSMPGQQQQTSTGMTTGTWTALPKIYQTTTGIILKLFSEEGETCVHVQNNSISLMVNVPSVAEAQQLSVQQATTVQSSNVMPPMPPMGNMQMTMQPMEMRMGNMELKMDSAANAPQPETARNFCSQCGSKVAPEDRFCSNCGHALG